MIGAEALVRWQRTGYGLVPPFKFIPIAETTGLILPLGEEVLNLACQRLRDWLDQGVRAPAISINVAARQLNRADLVDIISRYLAKYELEARYIEVEITESALMEDPEKTVTLLSRLRDLGIRISLDDFGTGYSNLSYLTRYPMDTLKIDASFIRQMHENPNAMKLVNSIIELGHNIGLRTIAEGVETREQLDYLRERGCDEIQGYYFSKPLPADEFAALIGEDRILSIN